jgi:hypothetical protein
MVSLFASNADSARGALESEADLSDPVERWLLRNGYRRIGHEVDAGVGVPDLVAGVATSAELRRRTRQTGPIVDPLQLVLLDFCATPRTEADLRSWAPNGYSALVHKAIIPLTQSGLLVERKNGIQASKQIHDPFSKLVAIELKLNDTTRGLRQAHSYRAFADAAYLAMPARRFNSAVVTTAKGIGVGLLGIDDRDVFELLKPDERSQATPLRRRVASERTLAAHGNKNQPRAGSRRGLGPPQI